MMHLPACFLSRKIGSSTTALLWTSDPIWSNIKHRRLNLLSPGTLKAVWYAIGVCESNPHDGIDRRYIISAVVGDAYRPSRVANRPIPSKTASQSSYVSKRIVEKIPHMMTSVVLVEWDRVSDGSVYRSVECFDLGDLGCTVLNACLDVFEKC